MNQESHTNSIQSNLRAMNCKYEQLEVIPLFSEKNKL